MEVGDFARGEPDAVDPAFDLDAGIDERFAALVGNPMTLRRR